MPSPQMEAMIARLGAVSAGLAPDVHLQRQIMAKLAEALPPDEDVRVEELDLGGVRAEEVWADGADDGRWALVFHGGGYVAGLPAANRQFAGRLSRASGFHCVVPAYRQAPEHPFPAAVEDAVAAYRGLLDRGVDPGRVVIGGDSAGGGLAMALVVAARQRGIPLPAAVFGISPWVDLTLRSPGMTAQESRDPVVKPERMAAQRDQYVGDADPADPLASPLFADLAGFPPVHVEIGEPERLLDEARQFVDKAARAGVKAELVATEGAIHGFPILVGDAPETVDAIARIADHLRRNTG